jgi:hypothetical protein
MTHDLALQSVISALGSEVVINHILGHTNEKVKVSVILAVNNGGNLTDKDIEAINKI